MGKIEEIIDRSIASGVMTQKEHDDIMKLIHKDGQIDTEESVQLSRIFSAVRDGSLKIVEVSMQGRDITSNRLLAEEKKIAVQRDEGRELQQIATEHARIQEDANKAAGTAGSEDREELPPSPAERGHASSTVPAQRTRPNGQNGAASSIPATSSVADCTYDSFGLRAQTKSNGGPAFQLRSDRLLEVNLAGKVWIRTGSMVAYYGTIRFTSEGIFEHGITKVIKRSVTGEGAMLTKATGQGNLFLADQGKKISVIGLHGESLMVSGTSLLAFDDTVQWDITFLKQLAATWTGGFFQVRLTGKGMTAITTHYDPIILRVTEAEPLMTDARATVAWSGGLVPQFKTDISAGTLIGRTSGETIQMLFQGDGFVVIQPYEEPSTDPSEEGPDSK